MTQEKILLATNLMNQMDSDILDYAIDMLRHIKFTQETIKEKYEKGEEKKNST